MVRHVHRGHMRGPACPGPPLPGLRSGITDAGARRVGGRIPGGKIGYKLYGDRITFSKLATDSPRKYNAFWATHSQLV